MLGCGLPTHIKAIFDLIDLIWVFLAQTAIGLLFYLLCSFMSPYHTDAA